MDRLVDQNNPKTGQQSNSTGIEAGLAHRANLAGDLTASPCNNLTSPPPDHSAVLEQGNSMQKKEKV